MRLGVTAVGVPVDRDGMRMDALAAALADCKARGVHPKMIYTIPTVQNPTGTILSEARRTRHAAARRTAWRADLRGRLLRRPDLERRAPARALRDEPERQRDPLRLVLQVDRAGAARRLHRGAVGDHVAHAGAEGRRRLGRARADGARRILRAALHRARAGIAPGAARQARDPDGDAERAVRHRGRVRRSARRHLPVGEAARQRRHDEALSGGAEAGRRDQSGPRMVDRREALRRAAAALLREPDASSRSARASRSSPKCAPRSSACRRAARTSRGRAPDVRQRQRRAAVLRRRGARAGAGRAAHAREADRAAAAWRAGLRPHHVQAGVLAARRYRAARLLRPSRPGAERRRAGHATISPNGATT